MNPDTLELEAPADASPTDATAPPAGGATGEAAGMDEADAIDEFATVDEVLRDVDPSRAAHTTDQLQHRRAGDETPSPVAAGEPDTADTVELALATADAAVDIGEDLAQQLQDLLDGGSFESVDAVLTDTPATTTPPDVDEAASPKPDADVAHLDQALADAADAYGSDAPDEGPAEASHRNARSTDEAEGSDEFDGFETVGEVMGTQPRVDDPELDGGAAAMTPPLLAARDQHPLSEADDAGGFETVGQVMGADPPATDDPEVDANFSAVEDPIGDDEDGEDATDEFETVAQVTGTEPPRREPSDDADDDDEHFDQPSPGDAAEVQRPRDPGDDWFADAEDAPDEGFESVDQVLGVAPPTHAPTTAAPPSPTAPPATPAAAPPDSAARGVEDVPVVQSMAELDDLLAEGAEVEVEAGGAFDADPFAEDGYGDADFADAADFADVSEFTDVDEAIAAPAIAANATAAPPPAPPPAPAPAPPPDARGSHPPGSMPSDSPPHAEAEHPILDASGVVKSASTMSPLRRRLAVAAPAALRVARQSIGVTHRLAHRGCSTLNKPLDRLDPTTRQTLGWVGVMLLAQGVGFALWAWWAS